MNLFIKGDGLIHGQIYNTMSGDLFYALKMITENGKEYADITAAYGEHENLLFSEVKTSSVISMAILDTKRKVLRGFRMVPATRRIEAKSFSDDNFEDRIAVGIIAVMVAGADLQPFSNFESTAHQSTLTEDEEYELTQCLNAVEGNVVTKVYAKEDAGLSAVTKPIQQINISLVETGMLNPSKIVFGKFEGFQHSKKAKKAGINIAELKNKFTLNPERIFTPEEKAMMFNIPKYYAASSNVISIAEKVKASWSGDPNLRKVNILMEGPAGTGKTLDSKVLSALLGLPYTKITCFSDMDSSDVTGAILPVANEELEIPIPSDDEIFFDPAGCYERITGKKVEDDQEITEADVREAINEVYESFYASQEGRNSPRYVYYASEIVKAFENGWLCEVQEPTCVADAAVLLVLNSALEREGVINLAQRTVKRHPECIFVMTTNRDYEGCRPLNQALRDRFNITKKVVLPSTEEQVERLSTATGCEDEEFLRVTVTACSALNKFLEDEGINAVISLRGMQDFVADCMNGFDIRESVMEDLVYKISTGDDEVAEMENFLELSTNLFSVSLQKGE